MSRYPTLASADGMGLAECTSGHRATFTVTHHDSAITSRSKSASSGSAAGALIAKVTGPGRTAVVAERTEGGKTFYAYTPTTSGTYTLELRVGRLHIQGSPFSINAMPDREVPSKGMCPQNCRVEGTGAKFCRAGQDVTFTVTARDKANCTIHTDGSRAGAGAAGGGFALDVHLSPDVVGVKRLAISYAVQPRKGGQYIVTYNTRDLGRSYLHVQISSNNGAGASGAALAGPGSVVPINRPLAKNHVGGSPFSLLVSHPDNDETNVDIYLADARVNGGRIIEDNHPAAKSAGSSRARQQQHQHHCPSMSISTKAGIPDSLRLVALDQLREMPAGGWEHGHLEAIFVPSAASESPVGSSSSGSSATAVKRGTGGHRAAASAAPSVPEVANGAFRIGHSRANAAFEVLPGVWLGDPEAIFDGQCMKAYGVTRVVCCDEDSYSVIGDTLEMSNWGIKGLDPRVDRIQAKAAAATAAAGTAQLSGKSPGGGASPAASRSRSTSRRSVAGGSSSVTGSPADRTSDRAMRTHKSGGRPDVGPRASPASAQVRSKSIGRSSGASLKSQGVAAGGPDLRFVRVDLARSCQGLGGRAGLLDPSEASFGGYDTNRSNASSRASAFRSPAQPARVQYGIKDDFARAVLFLAGAVKDGKTVMVIGSRTSQSAVACVVAYLMSDSGLPFEDSLARLKVSPGGRKYLRLDTDSLAKLGTGTGAAGNAGAGQAGQRAGAAGPGGTCNMPGLMRQTVEELYAGSVIPLVADAEAAAQVEAGVRSGAVDPSSSFAARAANGEAGLGGGGVGVEDVSIHRSHGSNSDGERTGLAARVDGGGVRQQRESTYFDVRFTATKVGTYALVLRHRDGKKEVVPTHPAVVLQVKPGAVDPRCCALSGVLCLHTAGAAGSSQKTKRPVRMESSDPAGHRSRMYAAPVNTRFTFTIAPCDSFGNAVLIDPSNEGGFGGAAAPNVQLAMRQGSASLASQAQQEREEKRLQEEAIPFTVSGDLQLPRGQSEYDYRVLLAQQEQATVDALVKRLRKSSPGGAAVQPGFRSCGGVASQAVASLRLGHRSVRGAAGSDDSIVDGCDSARSVHNGERFVTQTVRQPRPQAKQPTRPSGPLVPKSRSDRGIFASFEGGGATPGRDSSRSRGTASRAQQQQPLAGMKTVEAAALLTAGTAAPTSARSNTSSSFRGGSTTATGSKHQKGPSSPSGKGGGTTGFAAVSNTQARAKAAQKLPATIVMGGDQVGVDSAAAAASVSAWPTIGTDPAVPPFPALSPITLKSADGHIERIRGPLIPPAMSEYSDDSDDSMRPIVAHITSVESSDPTKELYEVSCEARIVGTYTVTVSIKAQAKDLIRDSLAVMRSPTGGRISPSLVDALDSEVPSLQLNILATAGASHPGRCQVIGHLMDGGQAKAGPPHTLTICSFDRWGNRRTLGGDKIDVRLVRSEYQGPLGAYASEPVPGVAGFYTCRCPRKDGGSELYLEERERQQRREATRVHLAPVSTVTDRGDGTYLITAQSVTSGVFDMHVMLTSDDPLSRITGAGSASLAIPSEPQYVFDRVVTQQDPPITQHGWGNTLTASGEQQVSVARCPTISAVEWLPGDVCAQQCKAEGMGVVGGAAGSLARFTIIPKDAHGNILGNLHDLAFTVRMSRGSCKTGRANPIKMARTEDGNIICTYTMAISGVYSLSVLLMDQHIAGSQFKIAITEGPFTEDSQAELLKRTDARSKHMPAPEQRNW